MQERMNFAVFIDLENAGSKASTLNSVIEKVKIKGDILIGRVYGYSDRYMDLREVLLSNTFTAVPGIRYGSSQKNSMDIQLVVDALDVAYRNDLIDCFCIVSGDSDFTPLVGKLKSMGKTVLGISRSEVASSVFISACNEFIFLESVSAPAPVKERARIKDAAANAGTEDLNALLAKIMKEQELDADGYLYASELKKTLTRLRPDFAEKNYGFSSFSKLLYHLQSRFHDLQVVDDNHSVKVGLRSEEKKRSRALTQDVWVSEFERVLKGFKSEGFDRVNPSIIKAAIQSDYPDFDERSIGFRKFSDILRALEKMDMVQVELDESRSMLVAIK